MCKATGIPIRRVWGLNLYASDGQTNGLQHVRADYTNIHTWAEVFFPKVGWIEVEPTQGRNAFTIPAQFIQNNRWFQNYAIWIRASGEDKIPEWNYSGGKWSSMYGMVNVITFDRRKLGSQHPKRTQPLLQCLSSHGPHPSAFVVASVLFGMANARPCTTVNSGRGLRLAGLTWRWVGYSRGSCRYNAGGPPTTGDRCSNLLANPAESVPTNHPVGRPRRIPHSGGAENLGSTFDGMDFPYRQGKLVGTMDSIACIIAPGIGQDDCAIRCAACGSFR